MAIQHPKALPTTYSGITFRSRTEARWAVFFDALHVRWEYEPEGFDCNGIWYLPDFWLPDLRYWIEVKPTKNLADEDQEKIDAFAGLMGNTHGNEIDYAHLPWGARQFMLLIGSPAMDEISAFERDDRHYHMAPGWDNNYRWVACEVCGVVGMHYSAWAGRLCDCHGVNDHAAGDEVRILNAVIRSMAEKFTR